nr:protein piccolo-like [Dermacentor andersoni]
MPTPVTQPTGRTRPPAPEVHAPGHWTAQMGQVTMFPEDARMEGEAGNNMRADNDIERNGRPTPVTQPTGKTRLPAEDALIPPRNGSIVRKPGIPKPGNADIESEGKEMPTPVTQPTGRTRPPAPEVHAPGHWTAQMGQVTMFPEDARMEGEAGNNMRADNDIERNGRPTPVTQPTGKTRLPAEDALIPPRNGSIVPKPGRPKPGNADIESEGNQMPTPVTQPTGRTRPPAPEVHAPREDTDNKNIGMSMPLKLIYWGGV